MKRIITAVIFTILSICVAQAAQLPDNYVASNNRVFSVDSALYLDFANGTINVTYANGQQINNTLTDSGGVVFTKLLNSGAFVQVSSTRLMQPAKASGIVCNPSLGQTTFYWQSANASTLVSDPGCVIYDSIKAKSN